MSPSTFKLAPCEIVNEVRMRRGGRPAPCLLLEGESDLRAIKGTGVLDHGAIVLCAHGRPDLLRALAIADSRNEEGFIGVADADFDRVLDTLPDVQGVVWTGYNDLEMDMYCSEAFAQLKIELLGPDGERRFLARSGAQSLLSVLLEAADVIGKMRLLSGAHYGVGLARLIEHGLEAGWLDREGLHVDSVRAWAWLAGQVGCAEQEVVDLANKILPREPGAFAKGHDVSSLLVLVVRAYGHTDDVVHGDELRKSSQVIEGKLRCCFQGEHFRDSAVFEGMLSWQADNDAYCLLKTSA